MFGESAQTRKNFMAKCGETLQNFLEGKLSFGYCSIIVAFALVFLRRILFSNPVAAVFCFGFKNCWQISRILPLEMLLTPLYFIVMVYDAVCAFFPRLTLFGFLITFVHLCLNFSTWQIFASEAVKILLLLIISRIPCVEKSEKIRQLSNGWPLKLTQAEQLRRQNSGITTPDAKASLNRLREYKTTTVAEATTEEGVN